MSEDTVVLGRVLRPHGVRGALLLRCIPSTLDVLRRGLQVRLVPARGGGEPREAVVKRAIGHRAGAVLELEGVDDRDAAEGLAAHELTASRASLPAARAGEYYAHDLIGAAVASPSGQELGTLVEILETGANDVWVVSGPAGELLVPAVGHAVLEVDPVARRIVIDPEVAARSDGAS